MESHEAAVRNTNTSATEFKWSAVHVGYYKDPYIDSFAKNKQRRAPIMNRGYFGRVKAFQTLITRFINQHGQSNSQIVSLGAGFDTTYFLLKDHGQTPLVYLEVDFPEVVLAKLSTIKKSPLLRKTLALDDFHKSTDQSLHAGNYAIIGGDLRNIEHLKQILKQNLDIQIPTLFVAECVLVYLEPEEGNSVIQVVSSMFPTATFVVYDPMKPFDRFGQIMMSNFKQQGCPLLSMERYPDEEANRKRFQALGWSDVKVCTMLKVFRALVDSEELLRLNQVEIFDEFEEWEMIQNHYFMLCAGNGDVLDQQLVR